MRPIRNSFIKRGLIRPCVPTPLVKGPNSWTVGVPVYASPQAAKPYSYAVREAA